MKLETALAGLDPRFTSTRAEDLVTRLNRGVAWLDENARDWRTRITLEDLDLTCGESCVLAQVFGSYYSVVNDDGPMSAMYGDDHRLTESDAVDMLFTFFGYVSGDHLWDAAQWLWEQEILNPDDSHIARAHVDPLWDLLSDD